MSAGSLLSRLSPTLYDTYAKTAHSHALKRKLLRVKAITSSAQVPRRLDTEKHFADLQHRGFPLPQAYDYGICATWCRGAERVLMLRDRQLLSEHTLSIVEVGCGDGMTGRCLSDLGHRVILTDVLDWRYEKAATLPFIKADVCEGVDLPATSVDLVISFNTFEHLQDPRSALREIFRILKPGGKLFLDFGPLYCSPWGLHAWSLRFPYPQFLFSPAYIEQKIISLVFEDLATSRKQLQPTNRWRIADYRNLWRLPEWAVLHLEEDKDVRYLDLIQEFPDSFSGQSLTVDDLTVNSIVVVLQKKS